MAIVQVTTFPMGTETPSVSKYCCCTTSIAGSTGENHFSNDSYGNHYRRGVA